MEVKEDLKYEKQKQQVIQIAENQFSKAYFEKIDKILSKIENTDSEKEVEYTVVINTKGAFYAYEK